MSFVWRLIHGTFQNKICLFKNISNGDLASNVEFRMPGRKQHETALSCCTGSESEWARSGRTGLHLLLQGEDTQGALVKKPGGALRENVTRQRRSPKLSRFFEMLQVDDHD